MARIPFIIPSELYLADNRLSPEDGAHLRVLISLSNTLSLLDLRNNNLQVSHFKDRVPPGTCTRLLD